MKKNFLIVLVLLSLISFKLMSYAQDNPWVFVMDESGVISHPKKLIKTHDECLVSAILTNSDSIFVYKVSMQGQQIWKSVISYENYRYSIYDIIELEDRSIALVGSRRNSEFTEQFPYFVQLSKDGNVIKEIVFEDHNWAYIYYIDCFFGEVNVQLLPTDNFDTFDQYHYSLNLNLNMITPRTKGLINLSSDIGNNNRIFYKDPGCFLITNSEYDTLNVQEHNLTNVKTLYYDLSSELIYGVGTDSDSADYYGGIFVLNKDLEYLRFYPFDTLCPQKSGGYINDIVINQEGNLVLTGSVLFMGEEHASIYINRISDGYPIGGHVFYESMAQYSYQLIELDYGYALLQYSLTGPNRRYIVRVSADGDFNFLNENKLNSDDDLQVYPNPASSHICLQFEEPKSGYFVVLNMQGIKVLEERLDFNQEHMIDVSSLSNGMYLLQFFDNSYNMKKNQIYILKQ